MHRTEMEALAEDFPPAARSLLAMAILTMACLLWPTYYGLLTMAYLLWRARLLCTSRAHHRLQVQMHMRTSTSTNILTRLLYAPRALMEVVVGGQPRLGACGTHFFQLTPLSVVAAGRTLARLHEEYFGDEYFYPTPCLHPTEPEMCAMRERDARFEASQILK